MIAGTREDIKGLQKEKDDLIAENMQFNEENEQLSVERALYTSQVKFYKLSCLRIRQVGSSLEMMQKDTDLEQLNALDEERRQKKKD